MNVYYLAAGNDGCGYYRAYLPAKFLNGIFTRTAINIDWFHLQPGTPIPDTELKKLKRKLAFVDKSDIIVMQRPESPLLLKELAEKRWLKKFVYDNDDIMWGMDDDNPMSLIPRNREIIELIIQGVHGVTTTTDYLAEHYRPYNSTVAVLPNSLDLSLYTEPQRNTGSLRVLLTGSVAHLENMRGFQATLQEILRIYPDVTFVVHGLPPKDVLRAKETEFPTVIPKLMKQYAVWDSVPKANIEYAPFVPVLEYPKALAALRVDVAVIPRKENEFNKAKSNVKYLELAAARIPVIAQTFPGHDSPYDNDIVHGENGYLASTTDDWLTSIDDAMSNRPRITANAYEHVRTHYDIKRNIQQWKEFYQSL